VLSRGTVIVDETGYVGRKGHGQFVKRGLSQYLL
jgi:dihydropyrimidinase